MTPTNSGIPPEFSGQTEQEQSDFRWKPPVNAWKEPEQQQNWSSESQWNTDRVSIPGLVTQAYEQIRTLIVAQIQLFKLQAKRIGRTARAAAISFVIALVLLILVPWWLFHTVELLFALFMPEWAASLVTVVIILALVALFVYLGVKKAQKAANEVQQMGSQIQDEVGAVKEGMTSDY